MADIFEVQEEDGERFIVNTTTGARLAKVYGMPHNASIMCDRLNAAERKRDAAEAMYEALKAMRETHGMHGPCRSNNCRDCNWAYKKAVAALSLADGIPSNKLDNCNS